MTTSEYLRHYLEDWDQEYEPDPEDPKGEWMEVIRRIEADSIESLLPEALGEIVKRLRARRDYLVWGLDDRYTRTLINEVPRIVQRALKLEPLFIEERFEGPPEIYLRESTRAYLLGLFQGSVALSRSAVESALGEILRRKAPILVQDDQLFSLIKAAELSKLLEPDLLQFAHEVRRMANDVLHGTPCQDQDAFDALAKTRKILSTLYKKRR